MYNRYFVLLTGVLVLLLTGFPVYAGVKIGVVNPQRIIDESKAGRDAISVLKQLKDTLTKELDNKGAEIDALQKSLKESAAKPEEVAKIQAQIEKEKTTMKRMVEDADNELARKEKTFLEKIDNEAMEIIRKVSKDEGFTLILSQSAPMVLYADSSLDVTDKIIQAYDQTHQ